MTPEITPEIIPEITPEMKADGFLVAWTWPDQPVFFCEMCWLCDLQVT